MKKRAAKKERRSGERLGPALVLFILAALAAGPILRPRLDPAGPLGVGCRREASGFGLVRAEDAAVARGCPERLKHLMGAKMDLNRVSPADLDLLPGIGPDTADRVLKRRNELGRFVALADALVVGGRARKSLEVWTEVER